LPARNDLLLLLSVPVVREDNPTQPNLRVGAAACLNDSNPVTPAAPFMHLILISIDAVSLSNQ
jgi:hypothetical protein